MNKKLKNVAPIIAIFMVNALIYGFNALYYCFIQIYLEPLHSPFKVGILLAVGPFVAIIAPLFWGIRADKAKYKNSILFLTVIGSAIFYFLLMINQSFWWLFIILIFVMFFMSPFGGLVDTITLEYTKSSGLPYGTIRLMGTLAFGAIPLLLSFFTNTNINIIFYVYVVMAVLCSICILIMPKVKGHAVKSKKVNMFPIFRDRKLMLIFIFIAASQFVWGYYMNFFPTYITGELNAPQWVWGVNVLMTVSGEIPFFLMFTALFNKKGIKKLALFAIVLSLVRYFGLALITNIPIILIIGLFTGVFPTILTYCASCYINDYISPELKASGQTLMYALSVGIPKVLAGVIGGVMTQNLGVKNSMLICSFICIATFILYFFVFRKDNSKELLPK